MNAAASGPEDLWFVAQRWLRDVQIAEKGRASPEAIYFAAGTAVECGVKAIALRPARMSLLPDEHSAPRLHRHALSRLLKEAGLRGRMARETEHGSDLAMAWSYVVDWNPNRRYDRNMLRNEAMTLLRSVDHRQHGVMQWLESAFRNPGDAPAKS